MPSVEATFSEAGSLGLGFEAVSKAEAPKIKEVKAGTQATQHTQLLVGMKLCAVAGTACSSMAYADCINLIKAHPQRPITLKFAKVPHPSFEALLEAGEEGWTEDIGSVMDSGLVYIDRTDEFSGNSAMLNAAMGGHTETLLACLARDAQVDLSCAMDQTALVKAAGMGHLDIVKILLDKSAVRFAPPLPPSPTTCAKGLDRAAAARRRGLAAGRAALCQRQRFLSRCSFSQQVFFTLLLPRLPSQDVNFTDHRGMSAYLYACEHGHRDVVGVLCDADCDRAQVNREGFTGRDMAKRWLRKGVLELLETYGGGETPRATGPSRMGKAKGKARVEREAQQNLRGMSVLEDRARAEAEAAMMSLEMEENRMEAFGEGDEEEDEEEMEDEESGIAVTFTEAGSLGLKFTPNKASGAVEVLGINPGTQATMHPQLKAGLVLMAVGSTSVVGMPYKQVIDTIKAQGRPVTCQFGAGSPGGSSDGISVTFTEAGSLGLKFSPNKETGAVEVLGVNPGTQAETHAALKAGLVLKAVGANSVVGMPYKQVIDTIKAQGRPVMCQFAEGSVAPKPSGISVTFTEAGSLGLKFTPNKSTGAVEVMGINPGTQATAHAALVPGIKLMGVGATNVVGMPYKQVIETIKAQGRPVVCQFGPGDGGASPAQSPVAAAPTRAAAPAPAPPAAQPVSAAIAARTPAVLDASQRYTCVQRSMIRSGYSMESEKVGILEIGDVVFVKETRVNEANTTRVCFDRGWTNATMTDGRQVLAPLTGTYFALCLGALFRSRSRPCPCF